MYILLREKNVFQTYKDAFESTLSCWSWKLNENKFPCCRFILHLPSTSFYTIKEVPRVANSSHYVVCRICRFHQFPTASSSKKFKKSDKIDIHKKMSTFSNNFPSSFSSTFTTKTRKLEINCPSHSLIFSVLTKPQEISKITLSLLSVDYIFSHLHFLMYVRYLFRRSCSGLFSSWWWMRWLNRYRDEQWKKLFDQAEIRKVLFEKFLEDFSIFSLSLLL